MPTLEAPGRLMTILLCEGEFTPESFTVLGGDLPCTDTSFNHIKN